MKKILAILALGLASTAFAANFVQLEQEHVKGLNGSANSEVTYLRAGKDFGDYSFGVQSRTARFSTKSIANSLEATVSNKNVSAFGITPFVGVGHDFGSTAPGYDYGLVGATAGAKVGPGFAYVGAKTRVRTSTSDPKQTVAWAGYSVPVTKDLAVNVGVSQSSQDIKERGASVGVSVGF
jgi:hypothetical protein